MDNEQDKKYKELEEKFEALKRENENNCELAEAFCEYIATHSREIAEYIADLMMKADSAQFELACYKAEAVNNFAPFIQDRRHLIGELDSVKAQLDWHKRQLKAVKSDAESQERWANQYFEQAQKAEAERDRLHDLVRRLAQRLQMARLEGFGGPDRETLLDEAREAISEREDA